MTQLHSEPIIWHIVKSTDDGLIRHCEGAQSVFGKSRAQKIIKQLGPAWELRRAIAEEHTE